jgi:hypothetical protein
MLPASVELNGIAGSHIPAIAAPVGKEGDKTPAIYGEFLKGEF